MNIGLLNVGCIGAGTIFNRHADGWADSDKAELVAISDPDAEALNMQADAHDIARRYQNAADLLADPDIDIVDICAPNGFHAGHAIAALEAGKHVICQKPLAPTSAEIRQIIAARDKANKLVMTAQQYRFATVSQALKATVDAGRLGQIYHARCWYLRRAGLPVRPGLIYKRNSGGGVCIDLGVHVLDLTLWLMGNPRPVTVSGTAPAILATHPDARGQRGASIPGDIDVEDFAAGFVRFENGATLSIEVSWLLHHSPDPDKRIWVYGTEGGLVFPDGLLQHADKDSGQLLDTRITSRGTAFGEYDQKAYSATFDAFAATIHAGGTSPAPPEQSLQVQSILEGIYRSHQRGAEVRLD